MNDRWRFVTVVGLLVAFGTLLPVVANPQSEPSRQAGEAHHGDCGKMTGIKRARCERHARMYEKCHAIRGEAHHECDREFIRCNPLDCSALSGGDARACEREREAVRACGEKSGGEFFHCVAKLLRTDPRH
jgi:hypothetical protein